MLQYLKNRVCEASTWAGIGLAFTGGAVFYHYLIFGTVLCGVIATLTPDYTPPKKDSTSDS